ncbi:pollen-specific leucine-rich repeat extensin-like protein 1, partial [Acanthaster planci]|uniref:Pollen-specific leucine-rich repeat extensin-like protein 1 n=1 Tax=Acanthaster planci TaxID=133434 RepID=A0A8B7Y931_ACAPL
RLLSRAKTRKKMERRRQRQDRRVSKKNQRKNRKNRQPAVPPASESIRASRVSLRSNSTADPDEESKEDKPKRGFFGKLFGRKKAEDDGTAMRASRVSLRSNNSPREAGDSSGMNKSVVSVKQATETGASPPEKREVVTPPKAKSVTPSPPEEPPKKEPQQAARSDQETNSNRPVIIINANANDGSLQRSIIQALTGKPPPETEDQKQQPQQQQQQAPTVPPNLAYTGLSPQMIPYPTFQPPPFYGPPNPYFYPQMPPAYGGYPPYNMMSMPPVNNPVFPYSQNAGFQQQPTVPVQPQPPIQQPIIQPTNQSTNYANVQPMTSQNVQRQAVQPQQPAGQSLGIVEKLDEALREERRRPKAAEGEFEDSDSDDNFYNTEQRKIRRRKRHEKEKKRLERERQLLEEEERQREEEAKRKAKPKTPVPQVDLTGLLSLIETGEEPPEPVENDPAGGKSRPESRTSAGGDDRQTDNEGNGDDDELSRLLAQLGSEPGNSTEDSPRKEKSAKTRKKSASKPEPDMDRESTLLAMLRDEQKQQKNRSAGKDRRRSIAGFASPTGQDLEKRNSVPNLGLQPMAKPGEQVTLPALGQPVDANGNPLPTNAGKMSAERLLHEAQKALMSVQQSLH